ncbi:tumor protein p63-regulated gene 1-like protein [Paramacrobiotus metropolitanus]|uniref:tumor protein p63-regulated gene 1-like protein n=1 Tax=Paramacrobiotus metropolitanus TaxID=2943436 RepID=UPI002445C61B|nr:tumor protein p63-regulated gene 1-like protein [Paramacrobiotus metropolitanus]
MEKNEDVTDDGLTAIDFKTARIRFTDETTVSPSSTVSAPTSPLQHPSPTSETNTVPEESSISSTLFSTLRRLSESISQLSSSGSAASTAAAANGATRGSISGASGPIPTGGSLGGAAVEEASRQVAQKEAERSLKTYFAFRDGGHTIANAIKECLPVITDTSNREGKLIGIWLLTEISHWDVEHERLVFLTERNMIIVKYDLIQLTLIEYRRIPLRLINRCVYGSLRYPPGSIFEDRNQTGLRISWQNEAEVPQSVNWNPFSEVPYVTFIDHSAAADLSETIIAGSGITGYLLQGFLQPFITACRQEVDAHSGALSYEETGIMIENYAGILSHIYNKAQLGFFKRRGKIAF